MTRTLFTRPLAVGAALVATVAGGGTAVALTTDQPSTAVYRGCLNHHGGSIYGVRINAATSPRCRSLDRAVSWNQTGPAGARGSRGPRGATGPAGPQGEPGASGAEDLHYLDQPGATTVKNDVSRVSVMSLDLPAGSWLVRGQVVAQNDLSSNVVADCLISPQPGAAAAKLLGTQAISTVPVNGFATLAPQQVVVVPQGQTATVTLGCVDLDGPPPNPVDSLTIYDGSLTATSATTATQG
jgi:hypothetical protein